MWLNRVNTTEQWEVVQFCTTLSPCCGVIWWYHTCRNAYVSHNLVKYCDIFFVCCSNKISELKKTTTNLTFYLWMYNFTNYCNSNQKFYSQYPKWQISAYWDIGSNIIYVRMKNINQFILWSLKSTMKYNDIYNNFYTYKIFNDKWHKDLQQFSIDNWIDISYEIYLPYSDMQHHLLFLSCHS